MVGHHLKAKSGWAGGRNGTDDYGFSALPGGERVNFGVFLNVIEHGMWWNTDEANYNEAYLNLFQYNSQVYHTATNLKERAHSVRCVKD
jgi:uncharacterized protein (TIGR02145 family)